MIKKYEPNVTVSSSDLERKGEGEGSGNPTANINYKTEIYYSTTYCIINDSKIIFLIISLPYKTN